MKAIPKSTTGIVEKREYNLIKVDNFHIEFRSIIYFLMDISKYLNIQIEWI